MAHIDIPVEGNLLETLRDSFYSVEAEIIIIDNDEVNKRLISRRG